MSEGVMGNFFLIEYRSTYIWGYDFTDFVSKVLLRNDLGQPCKTVAIFVEGFT